MGGYDHDGSGATCQYSAVFGPVDVDGERTIKARFQNPCHIEAVRIQERQPQEAHAQARRFHPRLVVSHATFDVDCKLSNSLTSISKRSLQGLDTKQSVAVCEASRVVNVQIFGAIWVLLNFALATTMFACCAVLIYK